MDHPTIGFMRTIDELRVENLLSAIQDVQQHIASQSDIIENSPAVTQEWLVHPILDALGFTQHRRQHFKVSHCYPTEQLITRGIPTGLVITHPLHLDSDERYGNYAEQEVNHIRKTTGYTERIIITTGARWHVHNTDPQASVTTFSIEEPNGFWDLFMLGASDTKTS